MSRIDIRRLALGLVILTSMYLFADANANRLRALAGKVKCDCGCGDLLAECPHKDCKRTPALNQELLNAIARGEPDEQILNSLAAKYGGSILVTPLFQNFNILLWVVPILFAVVSAIALLVYRFRRVTDSDSGS